VSGELSRVEDSIAWPNEGDLLVPGYNLKILGGRKCHRVKLTPKRGGGKKGLRAETSSKKSF